MEAGNTKFWLKVKGNGEPILLLHGFTGTHQTWSEIEELLENYQLIMVDLPGHGKTVSLSSFNMESVCKDLKILLRELEIEKTHLLGYSMGGRTALSFAMIYPEVVKSLLLESASPGLASEKAREERKIQDSNLANILAKEGVQYFVDFWENIPLFSSQKNLPKERQNEIRIERLSQTEEGLMASLHGMGTGSQPSWWGDLHKLKIPTLIVVGSLDLKFCEIGKKMHLTLPNGHYHEISGVGHAIHVEKPRIFGTIVNVFMKNL
ncbi:2-succinyl-6-hydroxy-2,4-cyclohexadiene-1-carboxylate synthase [Bacillaceae bacterium S4-13-56]